MSRIKAVVFDLDDTLLDWSNKAESWEVFHRPMVMNLYDYLEGAGCELPGRDTFFTLFCQQVTACWEAARLTLQGASLAGAIQATLSQCGLDPGRFNLQSLLQAFGWRLRSGIVPYPEARPVLQQLQQQQYRLGLITNSFVPLWMRDMELAAYGLLDYLPVRLTSGDFGYIKPHPAIFQEALALLAVRPEQALFVGDHPAYDIAGANKVGMISVLIQPPHLQRDLNGVTPHYTITNLNQLLTLLLEL